VRRDERSLQEIGERIVYLERRERSRMSEWLELVAEFDSRGGARRRGFSGTAQWLAFECGLDGRTARAHVRVAKRLAEMPRVAEAFGLQRLSYSQVRAIARAPETEDESELLQVALTSTATQLERHVRQLRSAPSADLDVANATRKRRFVNWFWNDDGSLKFFGQLDAVDGAILVEAIEATAEALHADPDDPCCAEGFSRPPLGARRADALSEIASRGGVRTQLVLHADLEALTCQARGDQPRAGNICTLRDGPAIPSEVARRLICDADVSVAGLNLGRTVRTITPAQRRALEARDGRVCAMPGCHRTHGLEGHHIHPWDYGGRTDLDNLCLLCRFHHRLFHDDGFGLRRLRNGTLIFKDPKGRELFNLPPPRAMPALAVGA
jgi:Domain of unknown function (DUF222)/HNH endonuclease